MVEVAGQEMSAFVLSCIIVWEDECGMGRLVCGVLGLVFYERWDLRTVGT